MFDRAFYFISGGLFGAVSIFAWGFLRARRQPDTGERYGVYL